MGEAKRRKILGLGFKRPKLLLQSKSMLPDAGSVLCSLGFSSNSSLIAISLESGQQVLLSNDPFGASVTFCANIPFPGKESMITILLKNEEAEKLFGSIPKSLTLVSVAAPICFLLKVRPDLSWVTKRTLEKVVPFTLA